MARRYSVTPLKWKSWILLCVRCGCIGLPHPYIRHLNLISIYSFLILRINSQTIFSFKQNIGYHFTFIKDLWIVKCEKLICWLKCDSICLQLVSVIIYPCKGHKLSFYIETVTISHTNVWKSKGCTLAVWTELECIITANEGLVNSHNRALKNKTNSQCCGWFLNPFYYSIYCRKALLWLHRTLFPWLLIHQDILALSHHHK